MIEGVIKKGLFLYTAQFLFFGCCVVQYVYFILSYRALCRKPYLLRYRQLEVGWLTMLDKV